MQSFIFVLLFFIPLLSEAKIYVNIGSAHVKKSTISLSPFILENNKNPNHIILGKEMDNLLNKNLKFSSYFKILSPKSFIEQPEEVSSTPFPKDVNGFRFQNWKLIGSDFLLFSNYSVVQSQIHVNISFYNINLEKLTLKKKFTAARSQVKKLVNIISDEIVQALSGKKGIFNTKIVAIRSTSGSKKEIFLMDWNGDNQKRLTYHRSIVLSPAWSPQGKHLAYTAFVFNKKLNQRVSALFVLDLETQKIKLVSSREGANLGSDFFSNGKDLLVTLGIGKGYMDIFKLNIKKSSVTPITQGPHGIINVEPSINPRNNHIAFSSDRDGKTMIYTMDKQGRNLKRLTFAGHYNSTPDWDRDGKRLVFSGRSKGRFDLFLIRANGTGLKRLTSLKRKNGSWANCESPSFSPDGRFVTFTSDLSGHYQLYIMNLDDFSIERITFDNYNYKSPKWSPYL